MAPAAGSKPGSTTESICSTGPLTSFAIGLAEPVCAWWAATRSATNAPTHAGSWATSCAPRSRANSPKANPMGTRRQMLFVL